MRRRSLRDATVLITGAGGGLGRALAPALLDRGARLAPALLSRGARLALLDLDGAVVESLAAELGSADRVAGFACDVRSLESVTAATDAAVTHFGSLDVVVAGAGVDLLRPFATGDPADVERVVDIDLLGVWRTFRAAVPHLTRGGYLLAIASMASFIHSPLHSAYVAAKAGVWAMADSIRLELRPSGVKVGTVHPTFFASPMTDVTLKGPTAWRGIDAVVAEIVRAIEKRSTRVTVPRRLAPVALAPGLARLVVDRTGFRDRDIRAALRRTSD